MGTATVHNVMYACRKLNYTHVRSPNVHTLHSYLLNIHTRAKGMIFPPPKTCVMATVFSIGGTYIKLFQLDTKPLSVVCKRAWNECD